jgi:hypothetical protein
VALVLPSRDVGVVSVGLFEPVALRIGLISVYGFAMMGISTACNVRETLISSSSSLSAYAEVAMTLCDVADKRAELRLVKVAGPEETLQDSVSTMQCQRCVSASTRENKEIWLQSECVVHTVRSAPGRSCWSRHD